jgi:UTP-glucose-1-phosphate uridylyltransferase
VGNLSHGIVEIRSYSPKCKDPLVPEEGKTILKYAGRGVFGSHFFFYLEKTWCEQEEWDDTPAIQAMLRDRRVLGTIIEGTGFDVGNPMGYRLAEMMINSHNPNRKGEEGRSDSFGAIL